MQIIWNFIEVVLLIQLLPESGWKSDFKIHVSVPSYKNDIQFSHHESETLYDSIDRMILSKKN